MTISISFKKPNNNGTLADLSASAPLNFLKEKFDPQVGEIRRLIPDRNPSANKKAKKLFEDCAKNIEKAAALMNESYEGSRSHAYLAEGTNEISRLYQEVNGLLGQGKEITSLIEKVHAIGTRLSATALEVHAKRLRSNPLENLRDWDDIVIPKLANVASDPKMPTKELNLILDDLLSLFDELTESVYESGIIRPEADCSDSADISPSSQHEEKKLACKTFLDSRSNVRAARRWVGQLYGESAPYLVNELARIDQLYRPLHRKLSKGESIYSFLDALNQIKAHLLAVVLELHAIHLKANPENINIWEGSPIPELPTFYLRPPCPVVPPPNAGREMEELPSPEEFEQQQLERALRASLEENFRDSGAASESGQRHSNSYNEDAMMALAIAASLADLTAAPRGSKRPMYEEDR